MNILIINGPNLNFLGIREPEIYGSSSYQDLEDYIKTEAKNLGLRLEVYQSNHEGAIIDKLQEVYFRKYNGIIINAGAYAHYSYAIRDAIKSINIKTVEVHLSDVQNREDFRKTSVITEVCDKMFFGKGFVSYKEALIYFSEMKLDENK